MIAKNSQLVQAIAGTYCNADTSGCPIERISELVRVRAYQLYEEHGRRPGHELDDWLEAEQEFKRRFNLSDQL
jgi:DUF2934 family protein